MKTIKGPCFDVEVVELGKYSSKIKFVNFSGARGNYKATYGNITFQSYSYPAYYNDGRIYLPGSHMSRDNNIVVIPTSLLKKFNGWFSGKDDSAWQITRNDALGDVKVGTYHFPNGSLTTRKETASNYIKNGDRIFSTGAAPTRAQKEKLKKMLANLPGWTIFTKKGILCFFLSDWWSDYYRIGWLLLAVRYVTNHESLSDVREWESFKEKFHSFYNGKHTLTKVSYEYWSSDHNWLFNLEFCNINAFQYA